MVGEAHIFSFYVLPDREAEIFPASSKCWLFSSQKIEGSSDENLLTLYLPPWVATKFHLFLLALSKRLDSTGHWRNVPRFPKTVFCRGFSLHASNADPMLLQPLAPIVSTQALPWWAVDAAGAGLRAHIQSECRTKRQKSPPQWSRCFVFSFSCFSPVFQETCQNTVTTACNHPF